MRKNVMHELLKRPIAYQPIIAKAFGSVQLAILWSQLFYWSDKGNDPNGWIYKTSDSLYEETGLKRRGQETARNLGKKLGIILEKRAGVPATIHFKVDVEKAWQLIQEYKNEEPEKIVKTTKKKAKSIALPEWLDKKAWEDWNTYRIEIRKKLTASTIKSQIKMLGLNQRDHIAIIEASIQNGWTGLFALKKSNVKNKIESEVGKYANVGEKV